MLKRKEKGCLSAGSKENQRNSCDHRREKERERESEKQKVNLINETES